MCGLGSTWASVSLVLTQAALPHAHLPHALQLLLLVFIGGLEFLHLPLQLLLLCQQLPSELLPTLAGFLVWWGAAQLQQMDGGMDGYKERRKKDL